VKKDRHLFWELFRSTLKISAFTFGGGYVIVSLMRKRFVDQLGWIDENEMLDMIAIAQSSPGPIAVNASVMVGYHMAGIQGALVAVLGTILPPMVIIALITVFYQQFRENEWISAMMQGMTAGVVAVIAGAVVDLGHNIVKGRSALQIVLMIGAFVAVFFFKVNILWVILVCAAVGFAHGEWRAHMQGKGAVGGEVP
jgi:chromate transporter